MLFQILLSVALGSSSSTCSLPLDFWVGDWQLDWPANQGGAPDDRPGRGTNRVRQHGCALIEEFHNSETGLDGSSFTYRDQQSGKLVQTWTDTDGSTLHFSGDVEADGSIVLLAPEKLLDNGVKVQNRMRFSPVSDQELQWDLDYTIDQGESWNNGWRINYQRRTSQLATDDSVFLEIMQIERERAEAYKHHDVDYLAKGLAEEYLHTNLRGALTNKQQEIAFYATPEFSLEATEAKSFVMHRYGDIVVATGDVTWTEALYQGIDLSGEFRVTRVYVHRDGRWQLMSSHASKVGG